MKTSTCMLAAVICLAWYPARVTWSADEDAGSTDEQAVQALRDMGLPPETLLNMIRTEFREAIKDRIESSNQGATADVLTTPQPTTAPATVEQVPTVATVADFREALAPNGTWVRVEPYGLVWQPLATLVNDTWRPYFDDGSWKWTDDGWCWQSTYSWGWAPFHYGRWTFTAGYRWIWIPDTVWAPSWVQWRYSNSYVGWAPLPPEAQYESGIGFRYRNQYVAIDCDFGLTDRHYCFVPVSGFIERDHRRHEVPREQVRRVYNDTANVSHTHTTKSHVTLPALPREVALDTGRRTDNLRRIIGSAAGSSTAVSSIQTSHTSPLRTTAIASYGSSARRDEPTRGVSSSRPSASSTVQSNPTRQPISSASPPSISREGSDRRTSALLDVLRRRTQNSDQRQPTAITPAPAKAQSHPVVKPAPPSTDTAPRSTAVRTRVQSAPPQAKVTAKGTAVTEPVDVDTEQSTGSSKSGSRSSRLQSLLKNKDR